MIAAMALDDKHSLHVLENVTDLTNFRNDHAGVSGEGHWPSTCPHPVCFVRARLRSGVRQSWPCVWLGKNRAWAGKMLTAP